MIGAKRSIKTLKLLYQKLPRLLALMIGRMLFWLAIQTVLAMSTLFFEREFAMTATELAPIILLYLAVGVPSAVGTSLLIQKYSGNILRIFQVHIHVYLLLPLWCTTNGVGLLRPRHVSSSLHLDRRAQPL